MITDRLVLGKGTMSRDHLERKIEVMLAKHGLSTGPLNSLSDARQTV